jgi:hypothetical protein
LLRKQDYWRSYWLAIASVIEFKSLQDTSLPAPFIPVNVFADVQSESYWTETVFSIPVKAVWIVSLNGEVKTTVQFSSENFA